MSTLTATLPQCVLLSELAACLRVSPGTVREWNRKGLLPRPLPGRRLRWDRTVIESWLKAHAEGTADATA